MESIINMFKQAILKTVHYILSEVIKGFKWKRNQQMEKSVVLEVMRETRDNNANDNFKTYKAFVSFSSYLA